MSQPFMERVIYPIARKMGEITVKFTPQNWLNSISKKLELGGNPGKIDPSVFLVLQLVAAIGVGAAALVNDDCFFEQHSTRPGFSFNSCRNPCWIFYSAILPVT